MQGFGVTDTNGPLSMEVTEESELAQLKQLQALTRSQQRQILEHQEALASLHAMIRETQEAQVGALPVLPMLLPVKKCSSEVCTPWPETVYRPAWAPSQLQSSCCVHLTSVQA